MKIVLIGYGTIGKFLAESIEKTEGLDLLCVVDPNVSSVNEPNVPLCGELNECCLEDVDLVVEAANAAVVHKVAGLVLKHCDFLAFSLTAFSNASFYEEVEKLCKQYGKHMYIPHGAILGLDGVFDGRDLLTNVSITTIKTPKGLGSQVTERTVLYDGTAREACKLFPRNVNVHAGLSLAGIGFDRTKSVIIADPDIKGNTHIIHLEGEGIDFEIRISSVPKGLVTGVYTPHSAFGSIKRICDSIVGYKIV